MPLFLLYRQLSDWISFRSSAWKDQVELSLQVGSALRWLDRRAGSTPQTIGRSMITSNSFDDPLDRILAEMALRIQLPQSKHNLVCQRYQSVAEFAERGGSPLKVRITRSYPQGSMPKMPSGQCRPPRYARTFGAFLSHSKHAPERKIVSY